MAKARKARSASRAWLALLWVSTALTLALAASLVPHLRDSAELVRMRNALLLDAEPAVYDWTPASVPAGFSVEHAKPLPLYRDVVARHALRVEGDDWATALKIGRHLLGEGPRKGGPIQANLERTYERITTRGEGYCGDFADSFTGLATAAGIFSRPWAFSFDGYGGRGHIFNEIWDSAERRWIMIDVFNNMYFTAEDGRPLSATELRAALQRESPVRIVPIASAAPRGFKYDAKAIDYYRRGLPEWYMWWGNNVFEYDGDRVVRTLAETSRALEQLGAVAVGVHPKIRILETSDNEPQRDAIEWLRLRLLAVVILGVVALICLIGWLGTRGRAGSTQR